MGKRTELTALELEAAREKALTGFSPDTLGCRDMRHSWNRKGRYTKLDGGVIERNLTCRDCGMRKLEWFIQRTGERDGTAQYVYPEGYRTVGIGRLQPADIRRETFRRMNGGR